VGSDFTGSLTYYGIPDAVSIEVVGDTQLTITSSLTGLNRTFTGTDRDDLEEQLTDWLLEEGGSEVARLLKAAAEESAAAITDGNPSSATARMADRAFNTFAMYPVPHTMEGGVPESHGGIWFHTRQSEADTPIGTADSSDYELHIPWWWSFGPHLSLIGVGSTQYTDAEGTEVYGGGTDIGLGIRPVVREANDVFGWQITPFAGFHAMGTYDGATGGLFDQFGIANRFEFKLDDLLLVFATQYSAFDSLKLEIEDVEIDPDLEQEIVKNGLMVDFPLWSDKYLYANGFVVDTRLLEDAAIDNYQTLGGGLALRGENASLNLYVSHDFADDYSSWNAGIGLIFAR
jgi:hypothetical protein